ncbi:MAG TPA: DUF1259 domain-containing protein [Arsenicitalea sp.]|jgi:hypothetical protein|nr:DUF1259 domain-containing protein [Arsenicitalea sp.]
MSRKSHRQHLALTLRLVAASLGTTLALALPAIAADPDWQGVAQALGKSGTVMPQGVYRVGLPRSDLHVVLDGVELKPSLALGSWLAFQPMDAKQTMVMGDLVLTEAEIGPVMKKLEESNIDITALHNHLFRAQPATFYMHVFAQGDAVALAHTMHDALALSGTPFTAAPAATTPPKIDLDTAAIDTALGGKGAIAGGVYQVGIPRAKPVTEQGMTVPPAMGSAEAINFQPTGSGKAAITGDFVLTANEVNPVLRALREHGIEVTALHNHMLDDEPRLFFMHFWANSDLKSLLDGLHAAIGNIDVAKG